MKKNLKILFLCKPSAVLLRLLAKHGHEAVDVYGQTERPVGLAVEPYDVVVAGALELDNGQMRGVVAGAALGLGRWLVLLDDVMADHVPGWLLPRVVGGRVVAEEDLPDVLDRLGRNLAETAKSVF